MIGDPKSAFERDMRMARSPVIETGREQGDTDRTPDGALARFTLSFVDPVLESRYQEDGVAAAIREAGRSRWPTRTARS